MHISSVDASAHGGRGLAHLILNFLTIDNSHQGQDFRLDVMSNDCETNRTSKGVAFSSSRDQLLISPVSSIVADVNNPSNEQTVSRRVVTTYKALKTLLSPSIIPTFKPSFASLFVLPAWCSFFNFLFDRAPLTHSNTIAYNLD